MAHLVRFGLLSAAAALLLAAAPARALCVRDCDDDILAAGAGDRALPVVTSPRHAPPVEMSLTGYLWTKLRAEAHAYADATAFAVITATSRLAVVAARDKAALDSDAAAARAAKQPPHSECDRAGPPA